VAKVRECLHPDESGGEPPQVWIALLTPKGDGLARFRDVTTTGKGSITTPQTSLKALPPAWSPGAQWPGGNLSISAG
jgi:hypothetical protein